MYPNWIIAVNSLLQAFLFSLVSHHPMWVHGRVQPAPKPTWYPNPTHQETIQSELPEKARGKLLGTPEKNVSLRTPSQNSEPCSKAARQTKMPTMVEDNVSVSSMNVDSETSKIMDTFVAAAESFVKGIWSWWQYEAVWFCWQHYELGKEFINTTLSHVPVRTAFYRAHPPLPLWVWTQQPVMLLKS